MIARRAFFRVVMLVFLLGIAACSLDYDIVPESTAESDERPEIEIAQLEHYIFRLSRLRLHITAAESETYQEEKKQVLRDVYFWEYDHTGAVAAEGRADVAEIFLDTEDVRFEGSIRLYSFEEEAGITAEYLEWDSEADELRGENDETVVISRDDGTAVRGSGFLADMRSKALSFSGQVSGMYIDSMSSGDSEAGRRE